MEFGVVLIESLLALLFGFSTDFADLLDEHGLKWFKHAEIVFGIVWGLSGAAMLLVDPFVSILVVGLLLYWISVNKIDYLNHKIAAAIILGVALIQLYLGVLESELMIVYFVACLLVRKINFLLKSKYGEIKFIKFRHLIPSLIISILSGSIYMLLLNVLTMTGFVVSDKWFKWFEKNTDSKFLKKLGLNLVLSK